jgi:putative NADH-flavin reductase
MCLQRLALSLLRKCSNGSMQILLVGASGMVGQAALAPCAQDERVSRVTAVVRRPLGHAGQAASGKLHEVLCSDMFQLDTVADQLGTPDACLFCAGVSAVGLSETEYRRLTYDLTLSVARVLVERWPSMRFLYVSGQGSDSTEMGRAMWARVKGATENALLRIGFAEAVSFRPGYIQPLGGIRSKTGWYNTFYAVLRPVYPLLRRVVPNHVTDTTTLGRAMLAAVQPDGPHFDRPIETSGINELGRV